MGLQDKTSLMHVEYDHDPEDPRDQLELFIIRFPDVKRKDITPLLEDFLRFAKHDGTTTLEHARFLMLLESRKETKTATELWETMMSHHTMAGGGHHIRRISFLQWATVHFNKSWEELHSYFDEDLFHSCQRLIAEARQRRLDAEGALEDKRRKEEEEKTRRAEEIEKESKLTGVAAKAAFFKRLGEKAKSNQEVIAEEACIRRKIKEAKRLEQEAQEEARRAQDSVLIRERAEKKAAEERERAEQEATREEERRRREEKERRASFKAAAEARWLKTPPKETPTKPQSPPN